MREVRACVCEKGKETLELYGKGVRGLAWNLVIVFAAFASNIRTVGDYTLHSIFIINS